MNLVFIGCANISETLLETVLRCEEKFDELNITGVVTRGSSWNDDFRSLQPIANQHNIPCFIADEDDGMNEWLREHEPDLIYCFGWSWILKPETLEIPGKGVVGYHPAALPKNRGRHPIIWALALGLDETASTFFFMDENLDSGDIIDQETIQITNQDNAEQLYGKLEKVATGQVQKFTNLFVNDKVEAEPQDDSQANYWRKRTKDDGEIDWRMSARSIDNLVRALSGPYPGAHCLFQDEEIKIWETQIIKNVPENIEPGKVLKSDTHNVTIKAGHGAINIVEHEFDNFPEEGTYL